MKDPGHMKTRLHGHVMRRFSPGAGAILLLVSWCCSAGPARADVLNLGTKEHEGTFEGFANSRFVFRTGAGREVKESRTSVQRLTLAEPRKVALLRPGKKDPETVMLVGYEGGKFTVKQGNQETNIPGMQVRSIEVEMEMPEGGGADVTDTPRPIPPIDISELAARQDLGAPQIAVLEKYKAARAKYDAFIEESSALVAAMNKATGAKREELLNTLRRRKGEEQPIKRSLETSRSALIAAFPEITGGKTPQKKQTSENEPATKQGQIIVKVPAAGENEVFFLDTDMLGKGRELNEEQSASIERYNAVKGNYERLAADPMGASEEKAEALRTALAEAQTGLLKAFPNLKLVPEE